MARKTGNPCARQYSQQLGSTFRHAAASMLLEERRGHACESALEHASIALLPPCSTLHDINIQSTHRYPRQPSSHHHVALASAATTTPASLLRTLQAAAPIPRGTWMKAFSMSGFSSAAGWARPPAWRPYRKGLVARLLHNFDLHGVVCLVAVALRALLEVVLSVISDAMFGSSPPEEPLVTCVPSERNRCARLWPSPCEGPWPAAGGG